MKHKKNTDNKYFKFFIIFLIIALIILLVLNFKLNKVQISEKDRVLVIGRNNLVAVYEDKLAIKIPFEVNLSKNQNVGDLVKNKNYDELLIKINDILPEKLEKYISADYNEIDFKSKHYKNIPETNIDNERFILTSSVYSLFDALYVDRTTVDVSNENIIVDILNANGKGGYARHTGELIAEKLSMKYNAANYETISEESYIILNDISSEKAQTIISILPEKYFKIKENPVIPTLANVIIILGKEANVNLSIEITGEKARVTDMAKDLKESGYSKIETKTSDVKVGKDLIEYNKEDYFIAYKISKLINIDNMIENESLKNKVKVTLN